MAKPVEILPEIEESHDQYDFSTQSEIHQVSQSLESKVASTAAGVV